MELAAAAAADVGYGCCCLLLLLFVCVDAAGTRGGRLDTAVLLALELAAGLEDAGGTERASCCCCGCDGRGGTFCSG